MPDFAKCRTAEQVPRAEERAFSFPASHSLALGVSRQRPGGGGQKSERSAGVRCHCVLSRDGPGGERAGGAGSGSHQHSAVFTLLNQGVKPASGVSAPSFLQKV